MAKVTVQKTYSDYKNWLTNLRKEENAKVLSAENICLTRSKN